MSVFILNCASLRAFAGLDVQRSRMNGDDPSIRLLYSLTIQTGQSACSVCPCSSHGGRISSCYFLFFDAAIVSVPHIASTAAVRAISAICQVWLSTPSI